VRSADLLLHVADTTCPYFEDQIKVVESVLTDIGAGNIPRLLVPNKIDLSSFSRQGQDGACGICAISALTGAGVDHLLHKIGSLLDRDKETARFRFSAGQGSLLSLVRRQGRILEERYDDGMVYLTAVVNSKLAGQIRKCLRENGSRVAT